MGMLDRMREKARQRAQTADAEATAIEAGQGWIRTIGQGLKGKKALRPEDRPRYGDPERDDR